MTKLEEQLRLAEEYGFSEIVIPVQEALQLRCSWPECGCDPLLSNCYAAKKWREFGGHIADYL